MVAGGEKYFAPVGTAVAVVLAVDNGFVVGFADIPNDVQPLASLLTLFLLLTGRSRFVVVVRADCDCCGKFCRDVQVVFG